RFRDRVREPVPHSIGEGHSPNQEIGHREGRPARPTPPVPPRFPKPGTSTSILVPEFEQSPTDELHLILLMKDILETLRD
ncbi:MAG: hypothetical protein WD156_00445, partial [Acidimicrobiia bacterium]